MIFLIAVHKPYKIRENYSLSSFSSSSSSFFFFFSSTSSSSSSSLLLLILFIISYLHLISEAGFHYEWIDENIKDFYV